VMALILFSVSEVDKSKNYKSTIFILFGLSFLTIIVNGIALSAILFRINQYGITPNRIAVLGTNILIMVHLLSVARKIYESLSGRVEIIAVEKAISFFLPIYIFWTGIVTFLLPVIFNFK